MNSLTSSTALTVISKLYSQRNRSGAKTHFDWLRIYYFIYADTKPIQERVLIYIARKHLDTSKYTSNRFPIRSTSYKRRNKRAHNKKSCKQESPYLLWSGDLMNNNVLLARVPGHSNITWNEIADGLARNVSALEFIRLYRFYTANKI